MEETLSTNNDAIIEAVEIEQPLFPASSSEEPLQEEIDPSDIIEDLDSTDVIAAEIEVMMADPEAKGAHIKKKYSKISNEKRMELIDSVENHGQKIKDVASRLEINYSSAKSICQVYKREGRKDKKAFKNRIISDNPNTAQSDLMFNNGPSNSDSQYPVPQSQEMQEIPDKAPEKDSLMELRDRLLKSRLGKREELEEGQEVLTKEKQTQTYSDGGNNNNFYNAYNNGYSDANSLQQQQQQYEQSIMNQQRQMFQYNNNSNNQGFQQSGSNNLQQQNQQNNKAEQQTNTGDNNNDANRYPQQVYTYTQMPQQQHFVMMSSQPQYQNVYQGYTINYQQQNQSNMGQYNNSNNNSNISNNNSSNNNNNNTGQSGSQQNTNVQNFYVNDNTTTYYPNQGFQMSQVYSQMQSNNNNNNSNNQGQGQGQGQSQGQGQFYMTSGSDSNNGMQFYQMMQPMTMIPMNQNMQQGHFLQSYNMPDNNYNQQQQQNNNYFLVRGNQNQNQMQMQMQQNNNNSMQSQQHVAKDIKNESGGKMSSENIEKQ